MDHEGGPRLYHWRRSAPWVTSSKRRTSWNNEHHRRRRQAWSNRDTWTTAPAPNLATSGPGPSHVSTTSPCRAPPRLARPDPSARAGRGHRAARRAERLRQGVPREPAAPGHRRGAERGTRPRDPDRRHGERPTTPPSALPEQATSGPGRRRRRTAEIAGSAARTAMGPTDRAMADRAMAGQAMADRGRPTVPAPLHPTLGWPTATTRTPRTICSPATHGSTNGPRARPRPVPPAAVTCRHRTATPASTRSTPSTPSSSARATGSPTPPRSRSPRRRPRPTTRCSSTATPGWARRTCCTRSGTTPSGCCPA